MPTAWPRYYVRNPISYGGSNSGVHVVGYDEANGHAPPYVIPRGHVLEISPAVDIGKWIANKCIVPYDAEKHPDAILEAPAPVEPRLPAWTRQAEPGRELEREMVAMEAKAKAETRRQG